MIFISVDLPAPFSPSTAWISPSATFKQMPSFARTLAPAYALLISWSSSLNGRHGGVAVVSGRFRVRRIASLLLLLEHAQVVDFVALGEAGLGRIAPVLPADRQIHDHVGFLLERALAVRVEHARKRTRIQLGPIHGEDDVLVVPIH